jgi:ferredoxin-type protein NapH
MEKTRTRAGIGSYIASPLLVTAFMLGISAFFLFVLKDTMTVAFSLIILVVDILAKTAFALLPVKAKPFARHASMFLYGALIFGLAGVLGRQNFQIEGFLFFLFAGVFGGVTVHYINAKLIGPLVTGRNWCGWGCWTPMILDLLPFKGSKRNMKPVTGLLPKLRYIHLACTVIVVAALAFGAHYTLAGAATDPLLQERALFWFLAGNAMYYTGGAALAFILKDNRAFCKYICPVSVIFKATSVLAILRIRAKKEKCTECGACSRACMMNIDIPSYVLAGKRVTSTECVLCLKCVAACPNGALSASAGFDRPRG